MPVSPCRRPRTKPDESKATHLKHRPSAYALDEDLEAADVVVGLIDRPELSDLPETSRGMLRRVLGLSGPVIVEQGLLYLVGLSDTLVAGRYLAEDHLAGVTVSSYLLWVVGSLLTIVSVGSTALVARLTGAGDRAGASRVTQGAIALALALGTAIGIGGGLAAPWIVRAMNMEGLPAEAAALFLRIVLLVTPLLACTSAGIACLRGVGDTKTGMWVMILVNLVNVTLTWSLVRGFGPLPKLGFAGIATGTACAEAVGGLVVLALLVRGRSGLALTWRGLIPRRIELIRILRISLPAAGESMTNSACQLWFLGLINRLGPTVTAAHGVAIRCEALSFLTVTAFAVAASTLTGQYLGARRPDLARRASLIAWGIGTALLGFVGIWLYLGADWFFSLFLGGDKPQVAAEGVPVLRIVAFAMPALATINVLNGSLRGAGDTRWPWAIVVLGYLAVRMPLTYYLITPVAEHGLSWGLRGAWIAMLVDLCVRGVLVAARFLQGGWRYVRV
jgi:putative MATE family efflux protein